MGRIRTGRELVTAKSRWREFCDSGNDGSGNPISIGLAATFTVEPAVPYLGLNLLDDGLHPSFSVAPYNQIHQACLDPQSAFGGSVPQCVCFLWRIEELLARELDQWRHGNATAIVAAQDVLDELAGLLRSFSKNREGTTIVSTPPYPILTETAPSDLNGLYDIGAFHRAVIHHWVEHLSQLDNIRVLDLDALQREFGTENTLDSRKWYLYKQPYTESFVDYMAGQLGRIIRSLYLPVKKCVAIDCDNTIWGGVIGEDGLAGIQLGDEFPGNAFADFQRLLLHWKEQGALIAILSKNNEEDAWEVFNEHDGMVLQRPDISAWRIDWEPKPGNLAAVARELNIGTDSFVFIDDNPFEIEQMLEAHPEVLSILLPEEPADIVDELKQRHLFEKTSVSEEDRQRTDMIASERERTPLQQALSSEDFANSLELQIELFEPGEEHIGRVAQLINKTNQFNLTTVRRTEEEVRALIDSSDYKVFAARIQDRFGEYGLTGVVVAESGESCWHIDTFLLSCRVLGRKVETAILGTLVARAAESGITEFTGTYIETAKNKPVADFLPSHGFVENESGWHLAVDDAPPAPDAVKVTLR